MHQNLVFLKLFVTMPAWVPNCEIENFYEFFSFLNFHFFWFQNLVFQKLFVTIAPCTQKCKVLKKKFYIFKPFPLKFHIFQLPKIQTFSLFWRSDFLVFYITKSSDFPIFCFSRLPKARFLPKKSQTFVQKRSVLCPEKGRFMSRKSQFFVQKKADLCPQKVRFFSKKSQISVQKIRFLPKKSQKSHSFFHRKIN